MANQDTSEPKLPADELSSQIVDALISSGLLREESRLVVAAKLAAGTMSGPDWEQEIKLATAAVDNP